MTTQTEPDATAAAAADSFGAVQQVVAGELDVGYVDVGPPRGPAVLLLHGWPYDIHAFEEATEPLAAAGYRVLVPYLRGHGSTAFLSDDTVRNGEQAALAVDAIAFIDALGIDQAIVAGFDWGARTVNILAALWPERCRAMVSVSGYLIGSQAANVAPLHPRPSRPGGISTTSPRSGVEPATRPTAESSPTSSGAPRHRSGTSTTRPSNGAPPPSTTPTTSRSSSTTTGGDRPVPG